MKKELTRIITARLTFIKEYDDSHQELTSKDEIKKDILDRTGADDVEIIKTQDFEREI